MLPLDSTELKETVGRGSLSALFLKPPENADLEFPAKTRAR